MVLIYLSLGFLAGVAFVGLVRMLRQERMYRWTKPAPGAEKAVR